MSLVESITLMESVTLMLVGMSTVFVFLALMVFILQVSSSFFASWPEDEEVTPQKTTTAATESPLIEIAIALAAIERSDP